MKTDKNLIAIGRSRYLYNGIEHLVNIGYRFKAIITEEAYEEYDIKTQDFKELADRINASFFVTKVLINDSLIDLIKVHNVNLAISANWKFTIPEAFLNLFQGGILNFHLGNLPNYKGNATVNWSIINGEESIYANIHKMDPMLDAGDIISRREIPITSFTYISDIINEAERIAPLLYEEAVEKIFVNPRAFEIAGTAQGTRCYPRLPEDSQINWNQNADEISRLIRASSHPYKGAYTFFNKEKVTIWKAKPYNIQNDFCAIPGHVVELKKRSGNIMVACKDSILEIEKIEYNRQMMPAGALVKSIRQRFKYRSDV